MGWHNPGDQTCLQGFLGTERAPCEQHVGRHLPRDTAHQGDARGGAEDANIATATTKTVTIFIIIVHLKFLFKVNNIYLIFIYLKLIIFI